MSKIKIVGTILSAVLIGLFATFVPYGNWIVWSIGFIIFLFPKIFPVIGDIFSDVEIRYAFLIVLIFSGLYMYTKSIVGIEIANYKLKLSPMTHVAGGYFFYMFGYSLAIRKNKRQYFAMLLGLLTPFFVATLNETVDYLSHVGFSIRDIEYWMPGIFLGFIRVNILRKDTYENDLLKSLENLYYE